MCLFSYLRIYLYTVFLILGYIDISISSLPDNFSCVPDGPCTCLGANGEKIDLSPLVGTSRPLLAATNKELFMYNPCRDLPLNSAQDNECKKSFGVCHFIANKTSESPIDFEKVTSNSILGNLTKLALNCEAEFQKIGTNLQIVFKHTNGVKIFTTIIKLDCNEKVKDYELTIEKSQDLEHILTLSTQYACPHVPHHVSGGAVFFLILLSILAVYFIGGVLVLKFIRGAQGIEMIPNHEFWMNLPQTIKAGFMYLVNCSKSTPDSYEKI